MAMPDDYFTHLLQAYGTLKGDPQQRREVAAKILTFIENEEAYTSFETPVQLPLVEAEAPEYGDPIEVSAVDSEDGKDSE